MNERLGPFFTVQPDDGSFRELIADWQRKELWDTWTTMLLERHFPGAADEASTTQRDAAASTVHLGLCARVISPWLGQAASRMSMQVPAAAQLFWQPDGTTGFPLTVRGHCREFFDPDEWAAALVWVIDELLVATNIVRSRQIAWGNVTSSINGAVRVIAQNLPLRTSSAVTFGSLLCAQVQDYAGFRTIRGDVGEATFRRTSCCLYYKLLPVGTRRDRACCGDCVLRTSA